MYTQMLSMMFPEGQESLAKTVLNHVSNCLCVVCILRFKLIAAGHLVGLTALEYGVVDVVVGETFQAVQRTTTIYELSVRHVTLLRWANTNLFGVLRERCKGSENV